MFGITGVGADEITFYTYWCVEKGYARWAEAERRQRQTSAQTGSLRGGVQAGERGINITGRLDRHPAKLTPQGLTSSDHAI